MYRYFSSSCTNGLLSLPIHIQLSVCKPSLFWKVSSLWTAYSVSGRAQTEYQCRVCKDLLSCETETFHPEKGFLVLDGAQDAESRCWCWSSANMCRRPGTQIVRMNKGRNVCFLNVSFKWGESYKKLTSRREPQSQGQAPVRQAHVQHRSYWEAYSCYSYTFSTSKTSMTTPQFFTTVIFYCTITAR